MSRSAGMLIVDKPQRVTSHDVVQRVRGRLQTKTGHTGTLDPRATGALLICLGKATRLARFLQSEGKTYECLIRFGWSTDTYDADGEQVGERVSVPALGIADLRRVADEFVGEIEQVPPAYSAKKVRGQPGYKRARRGEVVVHQPVKVTIHSIDDLVLRDDCLACTVRCSSGTYVRTLADDFGKRIGIPAHLAELRRTGVGTFDLRGATTWEEIDELSVEQLWNRVRDPAEMFPDWASAMLNETGVEVIGNGGVLEPHCVTERRRGGPVDPTHGDWVRILHPDGSMIAAAELLPGGMLQPRVVLR